MVGCQRAGQILGVEGDIRRLRFVYRLAAASLGFAAMQEGGQGIARRCDAALYQNAPDSPSVIAAVGHQMEQHFLAAHLPPIAIDKAKRERGFTLLRAQSSDVLHQPVIQCRDRAAQRCQGWRFRGIGGIEAVGLPQQIGLEDGIDHMDMVEDPKAGVVVFGILLRVQRGDRIQQLAIGPTFVVKEGLQRLVAHRFLAPVSP